MTNAEKMIFIYRCRAERIRKMQNKQCSEKKKILKGSNSVTFLNWKENHFKSLYQIKFKIKSSVFINKSEHNWKEMITCQLIPNFIELSKSNDIKGDNCYNV
jgi:hypothetical protein